MGDERDRHRRPLSPESMRVERTLEGYVAASAPPRWMERLAAIDRGIEEETRRLERAHRSLRESCGDDPRCFAERWRETVERWPFDEELNVLIERHNEWFPVERRLPVDPHTGDYVLILGQSYRRPVLGPEWALERFPEDMRPGNGA
jgi:hypothetical protein